MCLLLTAVIVDIFLQPLHCWAWSLLPNKEGNQGWNRSRREEVVLDFFSNRIQGLGGGEVPTRRIVINFEFIANCQLVWQW